MSWQKLKHLIQKMDEWHKEEKKGVAFEKLVVTLLRLSTGISFVRAKAGSQPSGDARSFTGEISVQAKNYSDRSRLSEVEIEGDIHRAYRTLQDLEVYVLAVSRDTAQLRDTLDAVVKETGLDIVPLELSDGLSDLGALCVTFWEDIYLFFNNSDTCQDQKFLDWIEDKQDNSETMKKIEELKLKLEQGIQTRQQVYEDATKYLLTRFGSDLNQPSRFKYPIDLSKAIDRTSLESKLTSWWETPGKPVCYLEGEEGIGKSWLAAKWVKSICENKKIVSFWLDSDIWKDCKSLDDLFQACLKTIPGYNNEKKLAKLKYKIRDLWWPPTLIVLDGVNEQDNIELIKQILDEYFTHGNELEGKIRIRILLTTRSLHTYRNFQHNMWSECERISVGSFDEEDFAQALSREELPSLNIDNSLKDLIRIPRYFQIWVRLSKQFQSFNDVTKEMIFWEDLLDKIKCTDPQVRRKFDWQSDEDAQEILARLAREAKWTDINVVPQVPVEQLIKYFPNYLEIRRDLEEQPIVHKAGKTQVELNVDHIVLGWALYLSKLFDSQEFTEIMNVSERFLQELEPIPSHDRRMDALYVALQITAIRPKSSHNHLSQKRAALMYTWLKSSNTQLTNDQVSFWIEEDTHAYAQFIEYEFRHHNSPNYEDGLIEPLAKTWLNEEGKVDEEQIDRLAVRLKKWLLPTSTDSPLADHTYVHVTGHPFSSENIDVQFRLLDAALSILSQRTDPQFLEPLARCYEFLWSNAKSHEAISRLARFDEYLGKLMRWGYTEDVLDDLRSLAKQAENDTSLLNGIYGLAANLHVADLPQILERPLTEEDIERQSLDEQRNRRFKANIDCIRNQERLLIGDSPAANGNYHGLDYLAVRKDLPDLHYEDLIEIKKILKDVSLNAKLGRSVGVTLEDSCIENLLPWVAKYDFKSYAELACSFKLNALNQRWAQFKLGSIPGIIFKLEDRERIAEAILGMKQRLVQDIQADNSSGNIRYLTSLLTETLLFSASKEQLTDWFEFLSAHGPLRGVIDRLPIPSLLKELLPKSIVRLAQQKLETLRSVSSNGQNLSDNEAKEFSEEAFWCMLYAYSVQINEDAVKYALEDLKIREPDSTGTLSMLYLALSDSKGFLDEMLANRGEKIQKHLFSKHGRRFTIRPYDGSENAPSYDTLISFLPLEMVGSFLCTPDRQDDLSRFGKAIMERMCSILQGAEGNSRSVKELRFRIHRSVLKVWAEQNKSDFEQLADEYLTELSKSPQYCQALSDFTDDILCLLLCFQPITAMQYYRQSTAKGSRTIFYTYGSVETFLAQLWKIEECGLLEHRNLRRKLLEECLNDEEIMFMTLAALAGGGEQELWNLVTQEYLQSPYAKQRNLGVSILPWLEKDEVIKKLGELKSDDPSQWVREHATWAYEVAQQERSCREVYREALQTRDLFRISAVFEQMRPALSPTARWWREIEHKKFREESQDIDPRLVALVDRFWYRWGKSQKTKRNIEIFGRKLKDYCRGEKLSVGQQPRIAPWWKPDSD